MDERAARLSAREAAAVAAVRAYYAAHGRPPSNKEIGARLGVGRSQAHDLIKRAARAGQLVVVRRRGVRTQIRLADPLAEIATAALAAELARRGRSGGGETVPAAGHEPDTNPARLAA